MYRKLTVSDQMNRTHDQLFGLPNVEVENPHSMANALEWYQEGLDFADALHLALSEGFEAFYSFDARFVKDAKGRSDCRVLRP